MPTGTARYARPERLIRMLSLLRHGLPGLALLLLSADPSFAAGGSVDSGQVAWLLTASALVLFMTLPGLGMFYGGLVQARNVLSVLMQCFAICCIASVLWIAVGYSLAFSDGTPWLGSLAKAFLAHLDPVRPQTALPENVF